MPPGIFVYGNKFDGGDPDTGIPPTGWFVGAFNTGSEFQGFTVWAAAMAVALVVLKQSKKKP